MSGERRMATKEPPGKTRRTHIGGVQAIGAGVALLSVATPFTNGDSVINHVKSAGLGSLPSIVPDLLRPDFLGGDPTTAPFRDAIVAGAAVAGIGHFAGKASPKLRRIGLNLSRRFRIGVV